MIKVLDIDYQNGRNEIIGLSTDTKPLSSIGAGSTFYELDTGKLFIFDGIGTWYLV